MGKLMMNRLKQLFSYLLLVPAILPLVYVSGVLYPYITPKTFLLQGSGIMALAVFAYLALAGHAFFYGRLRTQATWIPAALLAVAYITSLLGIDFYRSFWGLFDRGDGLLTLTVITVFFYLTLLFADRAFLERLMKTIAVVAGVVAAIAVLQWVTAIAGEKVWFLPPVSGRIGSTLGNAAFLAGYLGMAVFIVLAVWRGSSGLWRRVYAVAAILSGLAILLAATRGTILALLAASGVALVFFSWKGEKNIRRAARYGLITLAMLAGFFFVFRSQLAQNPFEPVHRIASISLTDATVDSRLFVWSHVVQEALQRPFSGYGAEHIAQIFDKVYDPSRIVEQWFDRSHNAFLDYFVHYGVLGLVSYLALIGAFAIYALRLSRREEGRDLNVGFLLFLLVLTYALQNFFVFDTPASLWLLYALFAFLIALHSERSVTASAMRPLSLMVPGIVSAGVVLLIVPAVCLPLYANILLTRGYLYHLTDVRRANAYFERGLAFDTYADLEYGYQAYEMYTDRQAAQLSGEDRVAAYAYALATLTKNFEAYPYDARTATYLGHVLDTAPPEVAVDDAFDRQVLSRAIELSPLRAQAWYMTANISLRKADLLPSDDVRRATYYREAIRVLETYVQKEPTLPVPRYILATLYYQLGDTASAKEWADGAYPLYTEPDIAAARPAVKYYLAVEDWPHAVRFLADVVAENPADHDALYDLAKVMYLAGDPAAALRIVEELRAKNPGILETDQNFLNAITAYEQSKK